MKNWYFLLVAAAESENQRWSQPEWRRWLWSGRGHIAPVTLHRPCRTKTLRCACTTAPPPPYQELSRPCHLNMTRGSVNVYGLTAPALCSVSASSECAGSRTWAADTDAQRPGDHHSNPALSPFSHTSRHHLNVSESEFIFSKRKKKKAQSVMPHNAFLRLDRILSISRPCYLGPQRASPLPSWAAAVISFSHASQHWYCCIDYDLNVCFLYGGL